MPYIVVENFGGGMDVRRSSAAAPGGTMREIRNAFVNRGGEIEARKKWTRIDALSDLFQSSANLPVAGPFPTFDIDAVGFVFDDAVAYPAASAPWSTNGGGRALAVDDFRFGIYRMDLSSATPNLTFSAEMYVDEAFVAYGTIGATTRVEHTHFVYTTGDIVPTSHTVVTGRSGLTSAAAAAPHFFLRFDGLFGVQPGGYNILKSQTGAPETDSGTGFAKIDIRGQGPSVGRPVSIGEYFGQAAIFCEKGVQFWGIDADPANIAFDRAIPGDRLVATRTVVNYESGDLIYLASNGIRSLRARDSSNFAVRNDLGSPIDNLATDLVRVGFQGQADRAVSVVEPSNGLLIVIINLTLLVYSKFDGVSAWSFFSIAVDGGSSAAVMDVCTVGDTICIRRADNEVVILGDTDRVTPSDYDDSVLTVITHYFGVEQPYTEKVWRSIDLACTGVWEVEYSIDPDNEAWVSLGTITGNSHLQGGPQIDVSSPLIAFRFTSACNSFEGVAAAILSQFAIHYDVTEIKA